MHELLLNVHVLLFLYIFFNRTYIHLSHMYTCTRAHVHAGFPEPPNVNLFGGVTNITVSFKSTETVDILFTIRIYNDGNIVTELKTSQLKVFIPQLASNTNYTLNVTATNCAGMSQPTVTSICTREFLFIYLFIYFSIY